MYAPEIVAARLEQALTTTFRTVFPDGTIPRYSIADSHALTRQITGAVDEAGHLTRPLTAEEQAFVASARVLTLFDFRYFAERFCWIDDQGRGLKPLFPLWESQALVLDTLGRLERAHAETGHPDGLLVNVLKARQLGVSTLAEALVAHRVLYTPHARALAGADVEDQAGYLFRMVARIYDRLPWFLQPRRLTFVKNREMTFSNQSYLKTAWGKSTRGALQSVTGTEGTKGAIGRGQTFSVVHISELATWDNPEQLDSALFPAVPLHPQVLVILESTAEVAGDWWHQHWQTAAAGEGRFTNIFIPWYAEPAKYSLPPPADWTPSDKTLAHAAKCEQESARWLGRSITLSTDQLYWYERTRGYYEKKGELSRFLKEFCADDQECFQYAGKAIFTLEQLEQIDQAGTRRPLADVWAVEPARDIAELRRMGEDPPDPRRAPAPLSPRVPIARSPFAAEAFPVPPGYGFRRLTEAQLRALPSLASGVLAIWEYPRVRGRRRYVLSVDVADGLGLDYSSIDVIRLPTIEEPAEQVAQYVSNAIDAKQLAFVCDAIGRLYPDEDGIEALAAIETNNHGLSTQDTLQLHLGYSHFYVWEYADAASPDRRYSTKIGWVTSPRTRPLLLSAFHDAVTAFDPITHLPDLILNSPITRGQLRYFITPDLIGNAEAARGQHDDCIFSAAIGYYVAWRLAGGEQEPIAERRRRRAALDQAPDHARTPRDWRNSDATAEEADRAQEADDEFVDDLSPDASLHFEAPLSDDRARLW